jgi:hypothetical protein
MTFVVRSFIVVVFAIAVWLLAGDLAHAAAVYYRDLIEVGRVASKHGLPFWNVVASNQIRNFTPIPSPANLAFQAYTTLAAGRTRSACPV